MLDKQFNQGGTIRTLIAVLLSALVIIYLGAPTKATSTVSNIKNQVKPTKAVKAVTAKPTVEKPAKAKVVSTKPRPVTQVNDDCYRNLVSQYTDWDVEVMLAVERAESDCSPTAVNYQNYDGVPDFGLFQLHGQDILDPVGNVEAAHKKWQAQGYHAWVAYNTGAYLKYL